jgi:hypothetical protein
MPLSARRSMFAAHSANQIARNHFPTNTSVLLYHVGNWEACGQ